MVRMFLRSIALNAASIYIAVQILAGVFTYVGGYKTLITAAIIISIANLLVKPLINLLLLPLHLVTMGMFRWATNLITLYLVTRLMPNIVIHSFVSPLVDLGYLIIPSIQFSAFGAFMLTTLVLTIVFHFIYWLMQE